jgi:hypothetical protein
MSVFNGEPFLVEAIESILNQSFRDFEFIVVDDGSTDNSGTILDSYLRKDSRLRVFHQENKGLIESLNRGCGLAQGRYIARMDADDISLRDRLMWQVEFMEKHHEVGVVGGAVEFIDATGKSIGTDTPPIEDRAIKSALFRGECPFYHPTVLMRKEVFASVRGYRKIMVAAEDVDLWLRISDRFQSSNLKTRVLKYRRHPFQISISQARQQALSWLAGRMAALSRRNGNADPLDSIDVITPAVLARLGASEAMQQTALARVYVTSIRNMCDAGEHSVALQMIDILRSPGWEHAESSVIADFWLAAARLYWRQGQFARSVLTAGRALVTRPIILVRPFKPLLRRFGLIDTE